MVGQVKRQQTGVVIMVGKQVRMILLPRSPAGCRAKSGQPSARRSGLILRGRCSNGSTSDANVTTEGNSHRRPAPPPPARSLFKDIPPKYRSRTMPAISDGAVNSPPPFLFRLKNRKRACKGRYWVRRCLTRASAPCPPQAECGDHHADHQQRRRHRQLAADITKHLQGANMERAFHSAAILQCHRMDPPGWIFHQDRQGAETKRQQCGQALAR